jgi:hypothetical protein
MAQAEQPFFAKKFAAVGHQGQRHAQQHGEQGRSGAEGEGVAQAIEVNRIAENAAREGQGEMAVGVHKAAVQNLRNRPDEKSGKKSDRDGIDRDGKRLGHGRRGGTLHRPCALWPARIFVTASSRPPTREKVSPKCAFAVARGANPLILIEMTGLMPPAPAEGAVLRAGSGSAIAAARCESFRRHWVRYRRLAPAPAARALPVRPGTAALFAGEISA